MISQIGMNNSSAKMVAKDSVLIALAGQGKTRGTVAINRIPLTTNQSIAAMTFNENFIPEFVFYNLENRYDELRRMSSGDGSRGGLNKQLVGDIEIPYTEKKEQERIGSFFESLDRIITLHQRKSFLYFSRINDWEQRKLNEVAEFNPKSELPDEFEYVDLESVVGTEMISHRTETKDSAPSRAQRLAQPGDVFFQTVRPYQKNNYLFSKLDNNYVFSTGYAQMRPNIDTAFLMSFLQTDSFVKIVLDNCTGTSYPAINSSDLSNLEISLPKSFEEQKKVGKTIISIDNLITLHQRKCDETKKLKKFMLQKMFPKKDAKKPEIRFVGFTNDWEQRKLMEVAEYRNGKAHENEINDDGEYIVVNSKFVSTNGEIRKFSYAQNEPLYENEIAFVLSDVPNGRAIARTFLVDKSGKYTLNQRIAGITPHEDTDPYYLYIKMNRNEYFLKFDDGNKQTNLSIKDVLNYEDMYPSYKEQQKIGMYFQQLDHLITLHQRKCDELKEFKKYMLQNMFPQKG